MRAANRLSLPAFFSLLLPVFLFAQGPGGPQEQPEFLRQGQQLMRDGKLEDALALYRLALQNSKDSLAANIAAGGVLDLLGKGTEARSYFQQAIGAADTPEHKAAAQRAMAVSYAFESNCGKAVEYEREVFEYFGSVKNNYQQGEIANELARICLDSPDLQNRYPADDVDTAAHWYQLGYETGLKEPNIQPERVDLWNFRWEHAQARIAVRRGQPAEAQKHVAAAKAILEKGTLPPQQAVFFPYLAGYVAFFSKDYQAALDAFSKANQADPFVQCLMAQTYEKLGDKSKAIELYRKASAAISHNPPAAYAVPYSRKRLAALL